MSSCGKHPDITSGGPVLAGLGAAAAARLADMASNPIDIWLSGGLVLGSEGGTVNTIRWWAKQQRGGNTHHSLLQMALDILCCPVEML
ncbi:hypothetical protein PSTG_05454 [Puccinia striiformis f. sp. tritici PST-78]|uniref:Uncharacterized protein n=1 Tax=Puccinia striiformis f. sp. tritici PST-78 TaxID=1165861 RepID=A0A0L0VQ05_9BASI|nr:hypothetical protein PSTG_05454 [Puccinia striiformis f. sp. tritici PST-78]